METPGFEPGAFRMRSERDTTTLRPRISSFTTRYDDQDISAGLLSSVNPG